MVATGRAREIFADARALRDDALDMLAPRLLRNAAEKAWGAAKRATDALVQPRLPTHPQHHADPHSEDDVRMTCAT